MNFSSKYVYKKQQKQQRARTEHDNNSLSNINDLSFATNSSIFHRPIAPVQHQQPQTACSLRLTTPAPPNNDITYYNDIDDEPDTNVVTIKFDKLKDPSVMQAGDSIKCQNCDAYLSCLSKVEVNKEAGVGNDDHKLWKCEFCNFTNNLQVDNEEIPKIDDVTYMLQPAPGVQNATNAEDIHSEYVVYCIDISGSMSVSTKVAGNFRLPTDNIRRQRAEEITDDPFHVLQAYHERYISRLEAVQVAISENLTKIMKDSPKKKVGLVTFNQEVHSYGDGTIEEVIINGDYLNKKESIVEKANSTGEFKSIKDTIEILNNKVLK
jgi:hypothetical protein